MKTTDTFNERTGEFAQYCFGKPISYVLTDPAWEANEEEKEEGV